MKKLVCSNCNEIFEVTDIVYAVYLELDKINVYCDKCVVIRESGKND